MKCQVHCLRPPSACNKPGALPQQANRCTDEETFGRHGCSPLVRESRFDQNTALLPCHMPDSGVEDWESSSLTLRDSWIFALLQTAHLWKPFQEGLLQATAVTAGESRGGRTYRLSTQTKHSRTSSRETRCGPKASRVEEVVVRGPAALPPPRSAATKDGRGGRRRRRQEECLHLRGAAVAVCAERDSH